MEFKNEHNEKVLLPLNWWQSIISFITAGLVKFKQREIWLSRSVAVVGSIVVIKDYIPYILINKRGTGTPDYQGMWNIPCGYLDKNETTGEATMREVWEECGVNLRELTNVKVNYLETPWDTYSSPTENRQNVVFHHGLVAQVDELPETSLENNEPNEVAEVKWIPVSEYENYEYCFNHDVRIKQFLEKVMLVIESKVRRTKTDSKSKSKKK